MGRLIDESLLQEKLALIPMEERTFRRTVEELENAPTVEAIPKVDIQKALKEGSKDISENVLAIVREEYISKADYENRLKADVVAILTELKHELIDISWNIDMYDSDLDFECCYLSDINKVIRQKIDKLKGGQNEES